MAKKILITGARAPVALHFARHLTQAGHEVVLADSQIFPIARATTFKLKYERLPKPSDGLAVYGRAVEKIQRLEKIDLILPCCEEIFYLAAWRDLHNRPLNLIAAKFSKLAMVHNKHSFAASTKNHQLGTAETILLESKSDIENFSHDSNAFVFKPVWSRFANHVLICPSRENLKALNPTHDRPWVAQKFLPGEELCCWAFAAGGSVVALSAYRPKQRAGQGAAIAFEAVMEPDIAKFVSDYCHQESWTGQISFDFRRDENAALHVLECNPRATSGAHFFGPQSCLAASLIANELSQPDVKGTMTLPLAFMAYGLPQTFRSKKLSALKGLAREVSSMHNIAAWPNDRNLLPIQIMSLLEIATRAMISRKSLIAAATTDIEWNGNDLGPQP